MMTHSTPCWRQALLDMLPLCIAVSPWGLLCGSMALQAGLSPAQAFAMSALVFAGAAQLSALALIGAMAPVGSIFSTTAMVSARHLLYSASFSAELQLQPRWQRLLIAFLLTDEMYALVENRRLRCGIFDPQYAIRSGLVFYLSWLLSGVAGIQLGQLQGIEQWGLDFAIAATFIALSVPMIKSLPVLLCVAVSALIIVIGSAQGWPLALIAAVTPAIALAYGLQILLNRRVQDDDKNKKRTAASHIERGTNA